MDEKAINYKFAVIGWGALLIWWGMVILIDPITLGMGAIGTGLILLGINFGRMWEGLHDFPTRRSNNLIAAISILWGLLDTARLVLGWDWGASFALFLIVIGVVFFGSLLFPVRADDPLSAD